MANMLDYLIWRGDVPFSVSPWNEIDALIVSTISCLGFHGAHDHRGWSIEEMTAPGCWFTDEEEGGTLGPWDWKIEAVREGDIAYGKYLGGKAAFATVEWYRELMNWRRSIPKYRMALGESFKASTSSEKLPCRFVRDQGSRRAGSPRAPLDLL